MAQMGPTALAEPDPQPVAEQLRRESDSFDEKKGYAEEVVEEPSVYSKYDEDGDDGGRLLDFGTDDPFPADPNALPEQQFTFRAVFVGCVLGAVISASKCVSQHAGRVVRAHQCVAYTSA